MSDTEKNDDKKNDISKILEEGTATALPPPAYDEVTKPPPAYPATSFSSSTSENNNQSPSPNSRILPTNSTNSNRRRETRRPCCAGDSRRRNGSCCCCWLIVLIVFTIILATSVANKNACVNINLGKEPLSFSFDSGINPTFRVNVDDARIADGSVVIIEQDLSQNSIITVEVYSGSNGIAPKFDQLSQNGVFELKVSQPGFRIFGIPPRCMKTQINVKLPAATAFSELLIPYPNTIQVKNLNLVVLENNIKYRQGITLQTINGDISLNNITMTNLNITTNNGDIIGNITSVSGFNVVTDDGILFLSLGNAQNPISKAAITTDTGDVNLKFVGSSFSGNYQLQSRSGEIMSNVPYQNGNIGAGNGTLNVITNDGDIDVTF